MDAAILFSDILMVPYALGQKLAFHEREGPVLERVENSAGVAKLNPGRISASLEPVFETARRVRDALDSRTTLIGFAGAPWTVATYMVEGGGSRDFRRVKSWAYRDPHTFAILIDLLSEATIEYLAGQVEAGAEVVQIFDSWAGVLPESAFARWVIEPTSRIVAALKHRFVSCPVIGFPRGAAVLHERYLRETGVDGVGLDTAVPPDYAHTRLQPHGTVQGNLDPALLLVGGAALAEAVRGLRLALGGGPYIFNLGHGVMPETPPENVQALAQLMTEPLDH